MRGIFCAAAVALLLCACTSHAPDPPASASGGDAQAGTSSLPSNAAVGFPELPPREPVPIDLNDVPWFDFFDFYTGDHGQQVRSDVLKIWLGWAIGTTVQECMVGHGYDWGLELPGDGSTGVVNILERYGHEGDWRGIWTSSLPVYQYAPNDAMLAGLGDAGSRRALRVLYGDLSAFHDHLVESSAESRDEAEADARHTVDLFLEMPRYTRETGDGGILEYAGGCVGQAREALPDFVAIPTDVSDAFAATATVADDAPLLVQARSAFDQCIDGLGITMDVDPAVMEEIDGLDPDLVMAAYGECANPYNDLYRRVQELARDQFARDYEPFLTARKESYDVLYASLEGDPDFQAFVDLLESQAVNAV